MLLAIEIGGTKLQLGVGAGDGSPLAALERFDVDAAAGAEGIRQRVAEVAPALARRHGARAVGCGFGGPIDTATGRVVKSCHIEGWSGFELGAWLNELTGLPVATGNDADTAGLGEALFGAGRDKNPVFYVTVGTGIGGGLIIDQKIYRGAAGAAELGHLRPGLHADRPEANLESLAAGWGIAAAAQSLVSGGRVSHRLSALVGESRPRHAEGVRQRLIEVEEANERGAGELLERCDGDLDRLTARVVVQAALGGNPLARELFADAVRALGWGLAQVVTLLAPEIVVVGGGVSLAGEELFFQPLRREVQRYVFPPLAETVSIAPASLGEEVVLHGALALAARLVV